MKRIENQQGKLAGLISKIDLLQKKLQGIYDSNQQELLIILLKDKDKLNQGILQDLKLYDKSFLLQGENLVESLQQLITDEFDMVEFKKLQFQMNDIKTRIQKAKTQIKYDKRYREFQEEQFVSAKKFKNLKVHYTNNTEKFIPIQLYQEQFLNNAETVDFQEMRVQRKGNRMQCELLTYEGFGNFAISGNLPHNRITNLKINQLQGHGQDYWCDTKLLIIESTLGNQDLPSDYNSNHKKLPQKVYGFCFYYQQDLDDPYSYNLTVQKKRSGQLKLSDPIYITVNPVEGKIDFKAKNFHYSVKNLQKNESYKLALDIACKGDVMEAEIESME